MTEHATPTASRPTIQSNNVHGGHTHLPEFVPLPREGQVEFYSGLRRASLNLLILPLAANGYKPPVKSISLRRPGLTKGKRLIALEGRFGPQVGLLTYLRQLRDEPSASTASPASAEAGPQK